MGKFIDPGPSQHSVKVVKHWSKASRLTNVGKRMKSFLKRRKDSLRDTEEATSTRSKTETSEFQNLSFKIVSDSQKSHLQLLKPVSDIFAADDLKANYEQVIRHDLIYIIFDEIALEGLCGITIEALWKRVQYTLKWPVLPWRLKEIFWAVICLNENVCFYQLPEERGELKINMDFSSKAGDTELISSRNPVVQDLYKVVIPSKGCTYMGSCPDLTTRKNITNQVQKLALKEAVTLYKNTLVLVGSEVLRKNALFDIRCDPIIELVPVEYCLLEWIGRMRDAGEITVNLLSSTSGFNMDARSLFHHCKILRREHLVVRQSTYFSTLCFDQKTVTRLISLRRFYQRKKSEHLILMESIINYLKNSPQCRAQTSELRKLVGPIYRKLLKSPEYGKYIDSHIVIPYRTYYKNSQFKDYMTKSKTKERTLKMSQLKDRHVNIVAVWDEKLTLDSSDDEEDDEEAQNNLIKGRRVMNKEFITVVYQFIAAKGREGATTTEVHQAFDGTPLYMRLVLNKLMTRKLVDVRKFDLGKISINKYVAKINDSEEKTTDTLPTPRGSRILEKMKEKQRQKVKSLPINRVYSEDQSQPPKPLQSFSTPKLEQPLVTINYLFLNFTPSLTNHTPEILIAKFTQTLKPFNFKLQTCKVDNVLTCELPELTSTVVEPQLGIPEPSTRKFKPDHFTKAFLLRVFMDNFQLNSVIDFLDPGKSKKPEKRASEQPTEVLDSKIASTRLPPGLLTSLGVEFKVVSREEIENMMFSMEVYESIPSVQYKTGDISQYKCNNTGMVTDRILGRIRLILKTIQEQSVLDDLPILLKIVVEEETKTGYDKKMDRKSLHRLIKKITNEGYIKLFHVVVSRADYKRNQTFVCHPTINLENYKLKESLMLLKEKTLAYAKKSPVKSSVKQKAQKSPFTQDDVLSSFYEVKMFMDEIPDTVKVPRKVLGKHFGLRPKFARLALIHEFLFYTIYELDSNTQPLSKTAVQRLFTDHKLSLTAEELDNLPPVYANEISWKTFLSPLPHHQNWDDGWALLSDIVLRFPIVLIFRSHAVNFTSTEQQEVFNHPYKRFFLAKNVSASMRQTIMHKRKFIADLAQHITLLGFCGLVQKGPYAFHDKDRMFFYLNRHATLWDTTSSKPSCLTIEEKEYPKIHFHFKTGQDVIKYWSTMNSICIRTNLNLKNVTNKVVDTRPFSKLSLASTRIIRTAENVKKFDTGELPGDHKGAAGLDSSLFAHRARNWTFFANKSTPGEMESLLSLKLEKAEVPTAIVQAKKLPKYYIAKSSDKQTMESGRRKKLMKFKRFTKNTKPPVKRLLKKGKEIPFDSIDLAIMRRCPRYRPKWTDAEDQLVILLKIASFFVTPGLNHQKVHYRVLRDILHIVSPKSRDKSSRTVSNRLKLRKDLPVLSNFNNLLPNLSKLPVMAQYFFPLRSYIANAQLIDGHSQKSVLSESELKAAFVFLAYYFVKNQKEVEVALHGNYTTLDYFNNQNRPVYENQIQPFYQKKLIFDLPTCEADIVSNTLKNTIICALGHRGTKSETCLHAYKIYQQYNQDVLKSTLNELKTHRMIQTHKKSNVFFGRYRLSACYVFSNSTTFWNNTMETAYETFLDVKHRPAECDWNLDSVNAKNYGRFFGFNEVMSFMLHDARLRFQFPKYHLVLNPDMEDHEEIVEELAKRYQAKLKSEQQKTGDSLKSSSTRLDIDDYDTETLTSMEQPEEIVISDEVEPLDLTITTQNSSTIDNLKHWISDCIDAERVRSPSPELLNLKIKQEPQEMDEGTLMSNTLDSAGDVRLLTLEEIKEGMLKPDDETGKREVPYISDLTKLLTVIFEDRDCDERASYLMKKHFIHKYPTLEDVQIDVLDTNYLAEFLESRESIKTVWLKAEREAFVETPDHVKALKDVHSLENAHLADEILKFIERKGPLGAPGYELKEYFPENAMDNLLQILKILLDNHIVLKTGVTEIVFVHYKHQNSWLTNTFHPKTKEVSEGNLEVAVELNALNTENIQWYKIKPLPWIHLEGTLDRDLFKLWLSQVFSYCVENPKIPVVALCDKFCFLKPVDVFYLLEVLEEIGAVEIRRFPHVIVDLFSEYVECDEGKGTALDRFEELFVEPNNVSFTVLGSFFHNCKY